MPPPFQDPFELSRLLEDSKRMITRMRHDLELVHETQRDTTMLNCDLRDYNKQLRGEIADLRAQLAYATQTLTAQIREQVQGARSAESFEKKRQNVVNEQKRAIQQLVREKNANLKRIKALESQIRDQVPNAKAEPKMTKAQKKRQKREAERQKREIKREKPELPGRLSTLPFASAHTPVLPAKASLENKMEEKMMVTDEDTTTDENIPGLALLEDDSHSAEVIEQLKRHMNNGTGKENLPSFVKNGAKNKCFCIHEVVSAGSSASEQLFPSAKVCKVGGPQCNFLVQVVETTSGNRLRTFSPFTTKCV